MIFREGDFIETKEGLIFEVKGIIHPKNGAVAFLRYIPCDSGDRSRDGKKYLKIYPIKQRFEFLRKNYPKYIKYDKVFGREIQFVEVTDIKAVYRPEDKLSELLESNKLTELEKDAVDLALMVSREAEVKLRNIGITGSILLGLSRPDSDIDLVIYGVENGYKVYEAVKRLRQKRDELKPYDEVRVIKVVEARWGSISEEIRMKMIEIERRKALHGLFREKDYFIRLVPNAEEVGVKYGDFVFRPIKDILVRGWTLDTRFSIFTPTEYSVEAYDEEERSIHKLVSFRGRFTEQLNKGEKFIARGKLELVMSKRGQDYYQLVLGDEEDFLIPIG